MTEADLEAHVKERFGMNLHRFVRKKIEEDGLWDCEVADMLNVKQRQIGALRHRLGINRRKGLFGRFERKYGPGAVVRFKEMIEKPEKSLTDVGNYFGFSREYARQVYGKVYGCRYAETHRKKQVERKRKLAELRHPAKLMKIREKMAFLGFNAKIENQGRVCSILANGYRLGFKYCSRPVVIGGKQCFHFTNKGALGMRIAIFLFAF